MNEPIETPEPLPTRPEETRLVMRGVKRYLREASGAEARGSRHLPAANDAAAPLYERVSKAIRPSDAETARNPRARSATLRSAVRTAAPARKEAA